MTVFQIVPVISLEMSNSHPGSETQMATFYISILYDMKNVILKQDLCCKADFCEAELQEEV